MQINIIVYKRFLLGIFYFFLCNVSFASTTQTNDSLRLIQFKKCSNDLERLTWLSNLELEDLSDFSKRNFKLFNDFKKGVIAAKNEHLNYQLNLVEGLLNYQQSHYQKAIPMFLNTLNQKKFVSQNDSVNVLIHLKFCFERLLNYPKVFEMHRLLMDMANRNPEIKKKNLGLPLSNVYINMGLINQGIKLLKSEHQINTMLNDKYVEANFLNNLGVVWQKGNQPDSAIYYFKKAQIIIQKFLKENPNSNYLLFFDGLVAGNIGQALMKKNKQEEAIPLLKKDIYYSCKVGNEQNAAISYNELAQCYLTNKQLNLASLYLDSAYVILKEIDVPHEYLKNLKLKAELLTLEGKYKEATQIFLNYNILSDSIAATEKEILMLNQQIAFETNQLQQKIQQQEKEIALKNLHNERKNRQRTLLFISTLLLLSILVFMYFSINKIKSKNKQLSEKNIEIMHKSEMLASTLKEKELLIKEVHHRVKNNMQIIMSLLKLQAEKVDDKRVEAYFSEARNRIQSMALIHEFLYKKEKMDFLQMDKYIEQLSQEIKYSFVQPNKDILLHTNCEPILLDFDTSIPLGLIINELVTNAFKHAFPEGVGQIWVSFKRMTKGYELTVKDNGIGTPNNFETKKQDSLGMELIRLLSEQINAELKMNHNHGFEVRIQIQEMAQNA
jgi:two-component sensor histidine kinase